MAITARGEIWTVSGGVYASRPRPAVILQGNQFDGTLSVTLIPFTTDPIEAPIFRLSIPPDARNGLAHPSVLMVDKITTVPRTNLGKRVGDLGDDHMVAVTRAVLVFLGFG